MQDETENELGVHTPFPDFGLLPPLRFKSKARFLAYYYPTHLIVIADNGLYDDVSVTNDIEYVLYDVNMMFVSVNLGNFLADCVVIYRDSMGTWDQVLINTEGGFAGFESINKKLLSEAVITVCGSDYDDYKDSFKEFDEYYNTKE